MALPRSAEARLYYRASEQRFRDAELLLEVSRTTGAVYLAGYTVECILKALLLDGVAQRQRRALLDEFHGGRAHNIEWLHALHRRCISGVIPREIVLHLTRVSSWTTDLRYTAGALKQREADEFFESVLAIVAWAKQRM